MSPPCSGGSTTQADRVSTTIRAWTAHRSSLRPEPRAGCEPDTGGHLVRRSLRAIGAEALAADGAVPGRDHDAVAVEREYRPRRRTPGMPIGPARFETAHGAALERRVGARIRI